MNSSLNRNAGKKKRIRKEIIPDRKEVIPNWTTIWKGERDLEWNVSGMESGHKVVFWKKVVAWVFLEVNA